MAYTRPDGNNIVFDFINSGGYTRPDGNNIVFDFTEQNTDNITITTTVFNFEFGSNIVINSITSIPETFFDFNISVLDIINFSIELTKERYFCVISKTGEKDVELPLSSFQARRRSGESTYLSVVIPTTLNYIDDITVRANGTIKIDMAYEYNSEILQRQTIIETEINAVNYDKGSTNQSITLSGYKTTTYSPKTIILSHATYKSSRSGKTRYRLAKSNIYLNPGDTVTINNDTFIINSMTYYISPKSQTVEIESV